LVNDDVLKLPQSLHLHSSLPENALSTRQTFPSMLDIPPRMQEVSALSKNRRILRQRLCQRGQRRWIWPTIGKKKELSLQIPWGCGGWRGNRVRLFYRL